MDCTRNKIDLSMIYLVCLVCVWLLTGCLVMGGKSVQYGPKGAMVSEQTLEQIERGKTSKAKLISLLGEPTNKKATDGSEIYKYVYTREKSSGVAFFLILAIGNKEEQRNELFFEIKDDMIVDWWKGRQDF